MSPAGATIRVCPDGPLLVRGEFHLVDEDGAPVADLPPSVALCRCGRSLVKPLCDGSHKAGQRPRREPTPE